MIDPEDRWEPWRVEIVTTGGPDRIYDDAPKDDKPRPVGFTAHFGRIWLLEDEVEPLLWEGDNA